jgi:hypothetical protein
MQNPFAVKRKQFVEGANDADPTIMFPTGSKVQHVDTGKVGTITAQHQDRQHVNVTYKFGSPTGTDYEHVDNLRGA